MKEMKEIKYMRITMVNEARFEQAKHKQFLLKEGCLLMR